MTHYQIALILSFVTACFTFLASWTKIGRRSYYYQAIQCLVYGVASYFYGVYPTIIMMVISATRNYLVGAGRYKTVHMIIFSVLALVLGLWTNQSGAIGLLSVISTLQYSICSYFLKKDIPVKINIIINLLLWICYDILVRDFFSGAMDTMGTVVAVVTIVRLLRDRRESRE